jgi:hypothetical protein
LTSFPIQILGHATFIGRTSVYRQRNGYSFAFASAALATINSVFARRWVVRKVLVNGREFQIANVALAKIDACCVAGYYEVTVNGEEIRVTGLWENELCPNNPMPHMVEWIRRNLRWDENAPEESCILDETTETSAEDIARAIVEQFNASP